MIFSYAKYLSKQGKCKDALQRMKIAQEIFVQCRGRYEREYVDIVNNLAVLSLQVRFNALIKVLLRPRNSISKFIH